MLVSVGLRVPTNVICLTPLGITDYCALTRIQQNGGNPCVVLPPLSVGEMTLKLYSALNYIANSACGLRCALNGA